MKELVKMVTDLYFEKKETERMLRDACRRLEHAERLLEQNGIVNNWIEEVWKK